MIKMERVKSEWVTDTGINVMELTITNEDIELIIEQFKGLLKAAGFGDKAVNEWFPE